MLTLTRSAVGERRGLTLTQDEQRARWRDRSNRYYRNNPHAKAVRNGAAYKWRAQPENREWHNLTVTLRTHGLTLDQYHSLQERQDYACAICGKVERLVIDHDHYTGKVRGLLCYNCNHGLGAFFDNVALFDAAKSYIVSVG